MRPAWAFVLNGPSGAITDLPITPTLRFELDGEWTLKSPLPFQEDAATVFYSALAETIPTLLAYRLDDGTNTPLKFAGGLMPYQEEASADASQLDLTFEAPPAFPLASRIEDAYETNDGTAVADGGSLISVDAGTLAGTLIARQDSLSDTFISMGTIEATTSRQASYALKNVWDAIQENTGQKTDGGFDLKITPLDPADNDGDLAKLDIVATLGSDVSDTVRFEYGVGTLANCLSVSRQWAPPVNRVTVTVTKQQAYPDDPDAGKLVAATVEDTDSQTKYGLYAYAENVPSVIDNADLTDRATALLKPDPVQTITFEPDPNAPNCPQPWKDYWLGDMVSIRAVEGGLAIDTTERVVAIEIDIDEDGNETAHRLEFGTPAPTVAGLVGKLNKRLYWIEQTNGS